MPIPRWASGMSGGKNRLFQGRKRGHFPARKQGAAGAGSTAKDHKGYVVSVLGYADPTGNAAANERLSNRRAQAVINYLKQSGHLLPGRVLSAPRWAR